jgi:uncharacterized protein (DUF433 family)
MPARVNDILDLYQLGLISKQILEELPYLENYELKSCLEFAKRRTDHVVLA